MGQNNSHEPEPCNRMICLVALTFKPPPHPRPLSLSIHTYISKTPADWSNQDGGGNPEQSGIPVRQ